MRNVYGPDIPQLAVKTGPNPTTPNPQSPSGKPDVRVDFHGLSGDGPIQCLFGLPVYDPNQFSPLIRIGVAALPMDQPMPPTADELLKNPKVVIAWADVTGQTTGGQVSVDLHPPEGNYAARSILTFAQ